MRCPGDLSLPFCSGPLALLLSWASAYLAPSRQPGLYLHRPLLILQAFAHKSLYQQGYPVAPFNLGPWLPPSMPLLDIPDLALGFLFQSAYHPPTHILILLLAFSIFFKIQIKSQPFKSKAFIGSLL